MTHPASLLCAVQNWAAAKQAELKARRLMNAHRCEVADDVGACYRRLAHVEDYECDECRTREPLFQDFKVKHREAKTRFRQMQRVALRGVTNPAQEQP